MYDVIVTGAGIAGLSAAALLAKKGLKVCVLEKNIQPGGACGTFGRDKAIFDQGTSMFFGFGEKGFNPLRYYMNEIEEELTVVRHDVMYRMHYGKHKLVFYPDLEKFILELQKVFPDAVDEIRDFYDYIYDLYENVFNNMAFMSPSEMKRSDLMAAVKKDPVRQLRMLRYLSMDTEKLIRKFIKNPDVIEFFNKLTSTYCYTTCKETPAVMSVTMFVDNHAGGTYYPVGSSLQYVGKLEKAIEKYGSDIFYEKKVTRFIYEDGKVQGAVCEDGTEYRAEKIIYAGAVKHITDGLLPEKALPIKYARKIRELEDSYPSVVFYATVDKELIPKDSLPIEMYCPNPAEIDEDEITVYIPSLADDSICPEDVHVMVALGPSLKKWPPRGSKSYLEQKESERQRFIATMENYYPGFAEHCRHSEISTPRTLEALCGKYKGSVAGPKQMIGQELMKRPHAVSPVKGLYLCGESTVMGTGTPSVTISGISAANVILRDLKMEEFDPAPGENRYVHIVGAQEGSPRKTVVCRSCFKAGCNAACPYSVDVRGLVRRSRVGNTVGMDRIMSEHCITCSDMPCLSGCGFGVDLSFIKEWREKHA